eukprot:gene4761-8343_t
MTNEGEIKIYENKEDPKQVMKTFLKKKIRIEACDERVFIGDLICFDDQKNFVLSNSIEYILNKETNKENRRVLGQIMIAGKDVKKIWMQQKQE